LASGIRTDKKRQIKLPFEKYVVASTVLDGVYLNGDGVAVFHKTAAPTVEELEVLLAKIITRTMRILRRLGALIEEPDQTYLAETNTDGALRALQPASCTYRIALGPRAG
jgi:hypothetical protein